MNLIELLRDADRKLDHGEITIGEYEKMIAPLRDATPVVRCKDCRWRTDKSGSTAWMPCRALITPNDFYCPSGERKDGDHEQDKKS